MVFAFTIGRGNQVQNRRSGRPLTHLVVGRDVNEVADDLGALLEVWLTTRNCVGWGARRA